MERVRVTGPALENGHKEKRKAFVQQYNPADVSQLPLILALAGANSKARKE